MSRRVRAVPEDPVLHVDQAREDHLRQQLRAPLLLLPQSQEQRVFAVNVPTLHARQPLVQSLFVAARPQLRLRLRPVSHQRHRAVRVFGRVVGPPRIVARHPALQLVPDVQPGRHVPDGLRQRQPAQVLGDQILQMQRGSGATQAVIVVHEPHDPRVDPLVIGHVRVRRVRANRLGQDLGRPAPALHQVECDLGRGHDCRGPTRFRGSDRRSQPFRGRSTPSQPSCLLDLAQMFAMFARMPVSIASSPPNSSPCGRQTLAPCPIFGGVDRPFDCAAEANVWRPRNNAAWWRT